MLSEDPISASEMSDSESSEYNVPATPKRRQKRLLPDISVLAEACDHTGVQCLCYGGARGAVPPLTDTCAPPFKFAQNTVFGTSLKDKTAHDDGKKNNYVQT